MDTKFIEKVVSNVKATIKGKASGRKKERLIKGFNFDTFIEEVNIWILVAVVGVFSLIDYSLYKSYISKTEGYREKQYEVSALMRKIDVNKRKIQRLSRVKSNRIVLYSRLQALNMVKHILNTNDVDYTIFIKSKTFYTPISRLTTLKAKLGVFKYIPLKIVIKSYPSFGVFLDTVKQLLDVNLIVTGVESVGSRGNSTFDLICRLYVE